MKAWILSVSAVILLTSIIVLILPENKISKYVKSIFSLLVMLVIISPIIKIQNEQVDFSNVFYESTVNVDYDFIKYINSQKILEYEKNCKKLLEQLGVNNATIVIYYTILGDGSIQIKSTTINLINAVIKTDSEHIYIIEDIKEVISEYLSIKKININIME